LVLSFGAEKLYDVHVRDVVKKLAQLKPELSWAAKFPFGGFIREESISSWAPKFIRNGAGVAQQLRVAVSSIVEAGKKLSCRGEVVFVLASQYPHGISWRMITTSADRSEVPADSRGQHRKPYGVQLTGSRQLELDLQTA
jgi:hypothetical protein